MERCRGGMKRRVEVEQNGGMEESEGVEWAFSHSKYRTGFAIYEQRYIR